MHIGQPLQGQTVFVSGAAGATGFCAVQILQKLGLIVIGCAGSDDKVNLLERMGGWILCVRCHCLVLPFNVAGVQAQQYKIH